MKANISGHSKKDKKPSDIVVKTSLENTFDSRWAEVKI